MTITFVASGSGSLGAAGNFTVAAPAGVADGDLLIAVGSNEKAGGAVPSAPAGWTQLAAGSAEPWLIVWCRIASGEPANYTFTANGGTGNAVIIGAYRGQELFIDAAGTPASGASTSPQASSILALNNGTLVFAGAIALAANGAKWTPPAGMTENVDSVTHDAPSMTLASAVQSAGATGAKTAATVNNNAWSSVLIQICERSAGAGLFFGSNL